MWGLQVRLKYLRLYRRIFVLSRSFARFMTCRIQINNGIRIFLQYSTDPVSKGTLHHMPNTFQKVCEFLHKIHSKGTHVETPVWVREQLSVSLAKCFLEKKSHVHSMKSLKPAECHEKCKQKRNHHMIVAKQI